MAVAGLQNVSVFDSSFLREAQSPRSEQWGEQDRISTRASSLLRMWREIEGEHVVNHPHLRVGERPHQQMSERSNSDSVSASMSDGPESINSLELNDIHNGSGTCSRRQVGSENENEDSNSVGSDQSADLGEVERERVRQVFREWKNSGAKSFLPNVSHMNNRSRAQWLGDNERERVRIIMEWVQINCQQRGSSGTSVDEGAGEIGSQIELVRDGLLVNNCEIGERRAIQKLCGRQALLDLLARSQRERKRELEELLDHRPVSNFSHRNRIQVLLRGRFLRNEIVVQDERPTSRAASELGFLRQRHTVSGLREEFLSRLDDSGRVSRTRSQSDASSNSDHSSHTNDQFRPDDEQEVLDDTYDPFEPSDEEREMNDFHGTGSLESDIVGDTNLHGPANQVADSQLQVVGQNDQDVDENQHDSAPQEADSQLQVVGQCDQEGDLLSTHELVNNLEIRQNDLPGNWLNANEWAPETLEVEVSRQGHLQVAYALFREQDASSSETSDAHEVDGQVEDMEVHATEDFDWRETSAHVEEWGESTLDHEEGDWQQLTNVESGEWRDRNEEGVDGTSQESMHNEWNRERLDNDFGEHSHTQEPQEDWQGDGLQEAIDSWLDVPLGQEVASAGRIDAFYFQDDENVQSMELRELLSRRRVSSLLRSGFRASLDQLIQSYVERQGNASVDWEPDRTPSYPAFTEPDQEQQNGDQTQDLDQSDGVDRTSPSIVASHPIWEQQLQGVNWSRNNPHHRLGNDWEIINELRIDMVRLQQRLNNMQRMLEACMDMQLELQRSVRQEVSAALNRSAVSKDECKDVPPEDEYKWDCVRKGICCVCSKRNIDSLLYRCGHMCSCSRCAENLVQVKDNCPMCQAPIVEVIRAYSIQ